MEIRVLLHVLTTSNQLALMEALLGANGEVNIIALAIFSYDSSSIGINVGPSVGFFSP